MSVILFQPRQLGDLSPANWTVMASMTRNRADRNGLVQHLMATHQRQTDTDHPAFPMHGPQWPESREAPSTRGG